MPSFAILRVSASGAGVDADRIADGHAGDAADMEGGLARARVGTARPESERPSR